MSLLDTLYVGSLILGLVYALVAYAAGSLHLPHVHAGHDLSLGHVTPNGHGAPGHAHGDDLDAQAISFFSPLTVTTFLAGFGAAGIVTSLGLHLPAVLSLPASLLLAAVIAYGGFRLFVRYLLASQISSESIVSQLTGVPAEVSVAIAPGSLGAITYTDVGRRYTMPARGIGGESFALGTRVYIARVQGNVAEVWRGQTEPTS